MVLKQSEPTEIDGQSTVVQHGLEARDPWRSAASVTMTRFWRLVLVAAAVSLLLGVLAYILTFAGIPHQSPAPKMRAAYYTNYTLTIGGGVRVVPERDWTLKVGKGCCGIQGYLFGTRLVCGRFSTLIPLPFFTVVALGLAVGFVVGTFSWVYWSRARKASAHARAI